MIRTIIVRLSKLLSIVLTIKLLIISFLIIPYFGCQRKKIQIEYLDFIKGYEELFSAAGDTFIFSDMTGLAQIENGDIIVADSDAHQLAVISENLKLKSVIGRIGQGPGEFYYPSWIKAGEYGYFYVLDEENKRIQKFDSSGTFMKTIKPKFTNYVGSGFDVDRLGNIYVYSMSDSSLISVFDENAVLLYTFGERVKSTVEPDVAANRVLIELDKDGNIYVAFLSSTVVRKYDSNHNLLWEQNLANFPPTRNLLKQVAEKREKERKQGQFMIHSLVHDIQFYDMLVYVLVAEGDYGRSLCCLDKISGKIVKIHRFNKSTELTEGEEDNFHGIDKFTLLRDGSIWCAEIIPGNLKVFTSGR